MTSELIFQYSTWLAIAGWIIIIIAPFTKLTTKLVKWGLIPILLSIIYGYLVIRYFGSAEGGFGSLEELIILFQNKHTLLAGWIHYLAFDLWIGCWEVEDAEKNNFSRLLVIPCLFFTLMYGPIGLLLYILIRFIFTRKLIHENF